MPFEIIRQDITKMRVDAIVNAANRSLLGGGGVDGAIHAAAGPELLAACRALGGCETGQAKITAGYRLPARYVIHTVGPVWHGGGSGERELLAACYRNSLRLALENRCETVAFPLISTGAYGYPKDEAMAVALEEISQFLFEHDMTVYLVVFGRGELLTGRRLFRDVQEYIDDAYAEERTRSFERTSGITDETRRTLWQVDEEAALRQDIRLGRTLSAGAPWKEEEEEAEEAEAEEEDTFAPMPMRPGASAPRPSSPAKAAPEQDFRMPDWQQLLRRTDEGFSQALLRLIDEKGLTDAECYKRANVDRKLFSKIRSNPAYKPSKTTALAFCVALELPMFQTQELLARAGFALTHSSKLDIIVEYFIIHGVYNVFEINRVLFDFDMPLLGSGIGA